MFKKRKAPPAKYNLHRTLANTVGRPNHFAKNLELENDTDSSPEKIKKRRWFKLKRTYLILFLALLAPFLVIGIWDLHNFSSASSKLFGSGNPIDVLAAKPLKDTDKRVNILLIGYSLDDPGHSGAKLTDSIMILSLDKDKKTGYMLSVPRDLYVDITDNYSAKINEAYQIGERDKFSQTGYPSGGTGLLRKVVSDTFKIKINYDVIINYSAVRDIVDALGGIEVTIKSPSPKTPGIYDPNFLPKEGGPLKLSNGQHILDGQTALRLTRARGSTYGSYGFPQSDFNRTQNQQTVLKAIKAKLNWKLILNPRTNGKIFDAVADNVETDLQINEILSFYKLINVVPVDKLKSINLADFNKVNLLTSYRTPTNQSALIPAAGINDFSQIQAAIRGIN